MIAEEGFPAHSSSKARTECPPLEHLEGIGRSQLTSAYSSDRMTLGFIEMLRPKRTSKRLTEDFYVILNRYVNRVGMVLRRDFKLGPG